MLNPVPKSVHFLNYLNFGALLDFFLWSICYNLCKLSIGYILANIELAQFVYIKKKCGRTMALWALTIGQLP